MKVNRITPEIHFNPRFPRGKRLKDAQLVLHSGDISIHASREGSDAVAIDICSFLDLFQSTLPAREATMTGCIAHPGRKISIHASREGSD